MRSELVIVTSLLPFEACPPAMTHCRGRVPDYRALYMAKLAVSVRDPGGVGWGGATQYITIMPSLCICLTEPLQKKF